MSLSMVLSEGLSDHMHESTTGAEKYHLKYTNFGDNNLTLKHGLCTGKYVSESRETIS